MMSAIDWSKAPEGATHYFVGSIYPFEKRVLDSWFYFATDSGQWVFMQCNGDDRLKDLKTKVIERPSSPAWNGEGLPPIGMMCEAFIGLNQGWKVVKILDHQTQTAACRQNGSNLLFWCSKFRPIRTPEQIAAEEREKAVMEIGTILIDNRGSCNEYHLAGLLHDAGYRKTGEGK